MKLKAFLFFMISSMALASCVGPKVPWCLWSVDRQEFDCVDANQKPYVCQGKDPQCDKMVATTPSGFDTLMQWIKRKTGK